MAIDCFPLGYLEKNSNKLENVINTLIKFQIGKYKTKKIHVTDFIYHTNVPQCVTFSHCLPTDDEFLTCYWELP
jgi:hypothetical protein